jgi:hypothetical protein
MCRKSLNRSFIGALAVGLVLGLPGCGGDDEPERADTATETQKEEAPPEPTVTASEPQPEETQPELEPTETVEPPPETSPETTPEQAPGGAGDEVPARSLALFTGDGGRITPRVVRVPAFISIRVELRSADGREYGLEFRGETVKVSRGLGSVSTTLPGLRPGAAVVGRPTGAGSRVRIEATAEPGP